MSGRVVFAAAIPAVALAVSLGALTFTGAGGQGADSNSIVGEKLTCASGQQVQSLFSLEGDSFEVVGTVVSQVAGTLVVSGPSGEVPATLSADVTGQFEAGQIVEVHGFVDNLGRYVATDVTAACDAGADAGQPTPGSGDDGDEADDEEEEADRSEEHTSELQSRLQLV